MYYNRDRRKRTQAQFRQDKRHLSRSEFETVLSSHVSAGRPLEQSVLWNLRLENLREAVEELSVQEQEILYRDWLVQIVLSASSGSFCNPGPAWPPAPGLPLSTGHRRYRYSRARSFRHTCLHRPSARSRGPQCWCSAAPGRLIAVGVSIFQPLILEFFTLLVTASSSSVNWSPNTRGSDLCKNSEADLLEVLLSRSMA